MSRDKTLMANNHFLSGYPLPIEWQELAYYQRIAVCVYLRMKTNAQTLADFKMGRKIWMEKIPPYARGNIHSHLKAIGELETRPVPYTTFREPGKSHTQAMVAEAYRKAHPDPIKVWFEESANFTPSMLYEKPNGGQRTLPSVYGRLRGNGWMRANRVMQPIEEMNDGHLENTLKLLMESHGNLQAKSTSILGKLWRHYQNQPEIQQRLEELCLMMQKVEVHEMYPIFATLAKEQASRGSRPVMTLDLETSAFDDTLRDW